MSALQQRRRLPACLLGLLCLAGQLDSVAHFVLVQHARCAEHGELIHEDAIRSSHRAASDKRRSSSVSSYEAGAHAAAEHAQHEHCLASSDRRDQVVLTPAHALSWPQLAQATKVFRQSAFDPLARERWLLAPKSSPPG